MRLTQDVARVATHLFRGFLQQVLGYHHALQQLERQFGNNGE